MKALKRKYKCSDPALTLKCQDVLDSIERDMAEFADHGFTLAKKNEFEDLITAFDEMPSDHYLKGKQQVKTAMKEKTRTLCETKIRTTLVAVENTWGSDSSEYFLFTENKRVTHLDDAELLIYIETFADTVEEHLAQLADEGITPATVAALRLLQTKLETAHTEQRTAMKNRLLANDARIKKGNTLFALLRKYCTTGKSIWIGVNEAKYKDYIIRNTPAAKIKPV